ncbi:hypothetical protein HDC37_000678 [Microbacterium sp. AK009]|uniref:DUF5719 family protein n=1 Tax=Microbacterium sp. AK009 TaxID=2723068 RepID=UPI0015C9092C|nr:DUF5719 family protein [Microbacterium sp. AK009]NYF15866.1 hypothetical protein [Microbacterium sp. AK009]
MSDRRRFRWAATSARMLAGTLAATGFVVGIVTLSAVPWPTVDRAPLALSVTPEPDTVTLACPGGLISLGRTAEDALGLSQAAVATVTSGVTGGGGPDAGAAEPRVLETEVPDAVGPEAFTAEPANREAAALAAAGAATVSDPDLSGFAASACRPPLTESWLVGGSGTTGAADLVILTNPGSVPATVQLTLFGASGEQQPAGGADIVVRAGAQRVVPLAGLLLGEQSPVIRVTATGSPIQASLQTSVTRTLQAAGIDQIGPIVAPSSEQVIAGVAVPAATEGEGADEGAETIVRVMAPAADDAGPISATVTVTDAATGASIGAPVVVPLEPGVPLEAELTGLTEGEYVVRVEANAPVVAAAWHTSGFSQGSDFAWFTPGPALGATALVAAPAGPVPVLTLVNTGEETASASVWTLEGAVIQTVDLPAGESAVVPLEPRTVAVIETSGGVIHAGLSLSGDNALAGYPVWPSDAAAPPTVVYP